MGEMGSCGNKQWAGGTAFLRGIGKDPSEEEDLSSDLKGASYAMLCGMSIPHRGNSMCKGPEVGKRLAFSRS